MRIGTRVVLLDSQKDAVGSAAEWHGQLGKVVKRAARGRKNQYRGFYWVETEGCVSVIVHLNDIWIDIPSSRPLDALLAAKVKETKERRMNTTVHQLAHNGACWELISGACWSMPVPTGQTIAETLLANGPSGEWPDDDSERVCFRVTDDCGDDLLDTDGDWRFVFTAGELRAGRELDA